MVVIFGAHSSLLFKAFHRQHSGIAPLLPLQVMMSANVGRLRHTIQRTAQTVSSVTIISLSALAADQKQKPHNTATNQRDRSSDTKTSGDQSNTSGDLQITHAIRRGLMKDDNLSNNAKNIKVITANGQVTLRSKCNHSKVSRSERRSFQGG